MAVVLAAAPCLAVIPGQALALQRDPTAAEMSALDAALRRDTTIPPFSRIKDAAVSLDFETGYARAMLCGRISAALGDLPVFLVIEKLPDGRIAPVGVVARGPEVESRCQAQGVQISSSGAAVRDSAPAAAPPATGVRPATKREIELLRQAFETDSDLFDPFSVQLRNVIVGRAQDGMEACGEFNAKNRYGAYTGFKSFLGVMTASAATIPLLADDETMDTVIATMCSQRGLVRQR